MIVRPMMAALVCLAPIGCDGDAKTPAGEDTKPAQAHAPPTEPPEPAGDDAQGPAGAASPAPSQPAPPADPQDVRVLLHGTNVVFGLDAAIVERIVRAHVEELRQCYVDRITAGATPMGRLGIKWAVGKDGTVARAEVDDDENGVDDDALTTCVIEAVDAWKFPKPADGGARCYGLFEFLPYTVPI